MTERTMPREPTEAMIDAGKLAVRGSGTISDIWRAMFDAAPTAAQSIADANERPTEGERDA